MNHSSRCDSFGRSPSSASSNAPERSEFERIMKSTSTTEPFSIISNDYNDSGGTSKMTQPTSTPSSSFAMQEIQQLAQQQAQSQPLCSLGLMKSNHASDPATKTAGETALEMFFGRTPSSQPQQGGVTSAAELMQNLQSAGQLPYLSSSGKSTNNRINGIGLKDVTQRAFDGELPLVTSAPSAVNAPINSNGESALDAKAINDGTISAALNNPRAFHGKGSFPLNLTLMLESVESMNLSHIISWLPGGQSFVIHNPDQFLTEVLPKFFKSSKNTKLRSFYRKLNRWGFSILRNHHLTKQGVGTIKGVWHHPEFYRRRAVECLKVALETGDTSSFLTVSQGKAIGGGKAGESSLSPDIDEDPADVSSSGVEEVQSSSRNPGTWIGQERRSSLRDSSTTVSTEDPQKYLRASHRESDFSLNNDSTSLDISGKHSTQQLEADIFSQIGGQGSGLLSSQSQYANNFNLSGSFTGATPSQSNQGGGNSGMMNKRYRRSVNYASSDSSSIRQYQPFEQASGRMANFSGRHQGSSASWTAGSTFSQHNFNFPSAQSLFQNNHSLVPEGQGDVLDNNNNVDRLKELTSMGFQDHQQNSRQAQGDGQEQDDTFTPEDLELANFFEKFADSLQK